MKTSRLVTLALAGGLAMWLALPAQAATVTTKIINATLGFSPTVTKGAMGSTFAWKNTDTHTTHTSTQNSPLGLWDTGFVSPGATKSTVIKFAGSYPYHCTIHPTTMKGTVKVPIVVTPPSPGTTATVFTITVATVAASGSFRYDVQKRVGTGAWTNYQTKITSNTVTFKASVAGTYSFRSRYGNPSVAGAESGWSPSKTVTVS